MSQFQPPQPHTGPMPPYPPQQPYYPPPPQPLSPAPPKRPRRSRVILIGVIAIIVVLAGLAVLIGQAKTPVAPVGATPTIDATLTAESNAVNTGDANASAELTAEAMTPTTPPAPTQPPAATGIGATQSSGPWAITINSVSTSQGDQYDTPKAGDTYLLVNFTGKNTGSSNLDMSPIYFTLRDEQGNSYDIAYITVPHDPRGTVVAGQQIRGDLSYEVPQAIHQFILQFDSPTDFDNSQVVQWYLSV